jgi:hypothetical protein
MSLMLSYLTSVLRRALTRQFNGNHESVQLLSIEDYNT